jgi:hypothetical protein
MRDTLFWRVLAVLTLLVALGYVVSRFTAAPAVRAGGEGGYIMEVVSDNVQSGRVFLLDTNRKVLLMYGSPGRTDLTMLASRFIDLDCQATVNREWTGKARGYTLMEVKRSLDAPAQPGRRR